MGGRAQPPGAQKRQIAQIPPAAGGRADHEFELAGVEVGLGGDLEGSAVVFRPASDDERTFDRLVAGGHAKSGKTIGDKLPQAFGPVRENPGAFLEAEAQSVDDCAVGSGAANGEKIATGRRFAI